MNKAEEVIEYKNHKIEIFQDLQPESPHNWENDDCFLVYDHRQFNVKVDGFEPVIIYQHLRAKFELEALPKENLSESQLDIKAIAEDHYNSKFEEYFIWTVYAYIHSGVSLSLGNNTYPFNDKWDVSSTGYILISKAEFDNDQEKALKAAQSLVETWNDYLSGNVYGYIAYEQDKEIDSVWGFYGDDHKESGLLESAESNIDYNINQIEKCNNIMHL